MNPAITTWDDLAAATGNVLLIVNSRDGAEEEVAMVLECLGAQGAAVHVIAPVSWRVFLISRGIDPERLLFAVDTQGRDLDLSYFLESARSLDWIWPKRFRVVAGSVPHSLYNEEIQSILEMRICLFLRNGLFVAHTLPDLYVYLFELADMFTRLGRDEKQARYQAVSRELIDDFYRSWLHSGQPAPSDNATVPDIRDALRRHLGGALLDFDEQSPIPLPHADAGGAAAATVVMQLGDMYHARASRMNDRRVAVVVRDALIERIPFYGLRRWLRRLVEA